MAIVVEGQTKKSGALNLFLWMLIIVILAFATYYIFFKQPEVYEVAVPANYKNTKVLVDINLDPAETFSSPQFQGLKQYFTPPSEIKTGRTNPFLGF